jgi:hypothetical protein
VSVRFRLSAVLVAVVALVALSGCDWAQFGFGPEHTDFNPFETKLNRLFRAGRRFGRLWWE